MSMMGVDEEDRKLFCGGLPQECTQDDLKVKRFFFKSNRWIFCPMVCRCFHLNLTDFDLNLTDLLVNSAHFSYNLVEFLLHTAAYRLNIACFRNTSANMENLNVFSLRWILRPVEAG